MGKLRQVSKQEYDVLRKFGVRTEIRFYAESRGEEKKAKEQGKKPVINGTGKGLNKAVQLSGNAHRFNEGTLYHRLHRTLMDIFDSDPTQVLGRTELRDLLVEASRAKQQQVDPFISQCLRKNKVLKYVNGAVR